MLCLERHLTVVGLGSAWRAVSQEESLILDMLLFLLASFPALETERYVCVCSSDMMLETNVENLNGFFGQINFRKN